MKAIIRVHSEEEALAVANDSEYGLSAAVYSRDSARAWNVAQRDSDLVQAQGIPVGIVPHAGHSMAWENPQGLAQLIASHS